MADYGTFYSSEIAARSAARLRAATFRDILTLRFPNCFMPKGAPKRPLKREIREDLVAACPDIDKYDLGLALRDYTGGPTYHRAMIEGEPRVALDGLLVGLVTAEEATYHKGALARLKTNWRRSRAKRRKQLIRELTELEAADVRDKREEALGG